MDWKDGIHSMAEKCKNGTQNVGSSFTKYFYLKDLYLEHEEELTIEEADVLYKEICIIEKYIFEET